MLCEDCRKNEASVVITVMAGDETTTRHLCGECMQKMQQSFAQGDVQGFLTSLLSILSNEPQAPSIVCSGCGLTYEEFERTGKLGCAVCYTDFAGQLRPLLLRIHGRSQHAGRVPAGHKETYEYMQCMDALRTEMDKAIASENFERAAQLRDEIKALNDRQEAESKT